MTGRLVPLIFLLFGIPALAMAQEAAPAPEGGSGLSEKRLAVAEKHMVAAAHPAAVRAGLEMLRAGGSAVDAAIAVQMVLGLVEPQSSGIGGGAFLVHWDKEQKEVTTIDAREAAPASARPDRFMQDGRPMPFFDAVQSGLSVGVPGVIRGLELAHRNHGRLPWQRLFEPAIKLATDGFPVSRRLNALLTSTGPGFFDAAARSYFFDQNGKPRPVGYLLRNPDYARTLRRAADEGVDAFYTGAVANEIVASVERGHGTPGGMSKDDLETYEPKLREPVCFAYRQNRICGMGPPSSGALTIAQVLKIVEPMPALASPLSLFAPDALHVITEAEKLAYADRNRYLADTDFVRRPSGFLDAQYLADRRKLINPDLAAGKFEAGEPPGVGQRAFGRDSTFEAAGTSHISIVDQFGNALAMTTTIESAFGSGLWAAGFLLNNELTDFSFRASDSDGNPIANRVEGGKRPRSSMSPTLVFDDEGEISIVTGSPGGARIILYVIKTLVAMIDWNMDAQAAAALTNFGSLGGPFEVERAGFSNGPANLRTALSMKSYGHTVDRRTMTSGIHTIQRQPSGRLEGGADPRREGIALGD